MTTTATTTPRHLRRRRRSRKGIIAAATVLVLVIASCSGASDSSISSESSTPAGTAPAGTASAGTASAGTASAGTASATTASTTPGSGLKTIDQAALQTLVDQTIKDQLIPGAVVLLQTPQGDFTVTSGTTERGTQTTPDANTHFRIASNTKTMTAAVILQLAQEGKLDLQDPVSKYVPGVPNGDAITVENLLKMRSGLYNFTNSPLMAESLDDDPSRDWSPQELLDIAFAQPPNFAPDEEFEYSNTNYVILALVIEKVDGRSLADAMQQRLFTPLGMSDTELPPGDSTAIPDPYSHGYLYGSSSVALYGTPEYTPEQIAAAKDGTLQPTDYTGVNHSFAFGAGNAISTAHDLAIWMKALVGGEVLDAEYQQLWLDSLQVEDPDKPAGLWYGYGITSQRWGTNNRMLFHGGETAGYNSSIVVETTNDVTAVVWTTLTVDVDRMRQTANVLMVKVLDQIYVQSLTPYASAPCPNPNIAGIPAFDYPATMQCGYLTVPENRAEPDGRQIKIFVARAPALSPTPGSVPLAVLSGGPGGAGSFSFVSMLRQGVNSGRDVIFVDQRGTHHADPLLGCADLDEFINDAISLPFSAEETTGENVAVTRQCRDRLAATGVDLSSYNTAENAADIAALRVALGIGSWDLYGVSYGTKLASVVLRDHPQGVRSVVLDSVSPPNFNIVEDWWAAPASSFTAIFAACAAQPACAAAYPNLEADFDATVNRLNESPVVVQTTDAGGAPLTVNIDGYAFLYPIIMASERGDASGVPKLIDAMARGDSAPTVAAMQALLSPPEVIGLAGYGLAYGVFCSESANLTTEDATLARAKSLLPQFPDQVLKVQPKQGRLFQECPVWDVADADAAMSAPVVSDVPVLIMEGDFDAATAPEWVDLLTPTLSASQVVRFPFTGHAVLGKSQCAVDVMAAFLDNPTQPVDGSCAAAIQLTFTTN